MIQANGQDWWLATNLSNVAHDLYSIAHHEMGHALAFHKTYDLWAGFKALGTLSDEDVAAYHGSHPTIDATSHMPETLDRASRRGAFGNEYRGDMPHGRWLITRLDLLAAQASGYELRSTSAFEPLAFVDDWLPSGRMMESYSASFQVVGGVPTYHWIIEHGSLPDGLALDSFTGTVSGVPTDSGEFEFTVRVRDYADWNEGVAQTVTLTIEK